MRRSPIQKNTTSPRRKPGSSVFLADCEKLDPGLTSSAVEKRFAGMTSKKMISLLEQWLGF